MENDLSIEKTVTTATNYKITKATDETLARIFAEKMGVVNYKKFLDWRGRLIKYAQQKMPELLRDYNGPLLKRLTVWKGHNIVPSVLRDSFASMISGNTVTPTFKANYLAIGSGSTPPANTDTKLVTEIMRGTFTNRFAVANVAYLDKFFNSSEVGGLTISELGVFVDGTITTDSGFLLSRILANEIMAATETLTINVSITIA